MKCNYCGNEVPDGSLTCPSCGGAIQQPQAASQQQAPQGAPPVQQTVVVVQQGPAPVAKSRTIYVILAFFFGGLSRHSQLLRGPHGLWNRPAVDYVALLRISLRNRRDLGAH